MNSLMILPIDLMERLEDEELLLINGGTSIGIQGTNNGSGLCDGTNNGSGRCDGNNNGGGRCGGNNNSDGVCQKLPDLP